MEEIAKFAFLLDLSMLKVRLESLFQHHDLHAKK